MKKFLLIIFLVFSANFAFAAKHAKNVILLIGDGMGLSQITYTMLDAKKPLNFEKFKTIGLMKTSSTSDEITDSAAAATAFSIGQKTNNGMIGLDANGKPHETILELASKKHFATGLIATSSITHATPAAFIAHQKSRKMDEEIAADFLKTNIDVFIGGGLKFFTNRKDGDDLTKKLHAKNYKIYTDEKKFFNDKYYGKTAALLALDHMSKMQDGRGNFETLALKKALKILTKNRRGFFLMVEGSQIDWAGHENNAQYIKEEMLDFNSVIGEALNFVKQNKDSLLIVLSDHETGGMALSGKNTDKEHARDENYGKVEAKFSSFGHSAVMVPVFAYGAGEEEFQGIYDNVEIYHKIRRLMRI